MKRRSILLSIANQNVTRYVHVAQLFTARERFSFTYGADIMANQKKDICHFLLRYKEPV